MTFLAPSLLAGALAAAVPIALHFFFRSRYRTVPWAAMKFLLTSLEQTSRRRRFQELLLLLARVGLLVLLALALARPSTSAVGGSGGDAVDAILLIDTSYSMGTREGATTRFDQARVSARTLLDTLPPHSTARILPCSDTASEAAPRNPADLDAARQVLETLTLTHRATDLFPGVAAAVELLTEGQAPNKELYLFSDMQRSGWEAQSPLLLGKLEEARRKASVTLVRCGTPPRANVAVVNVSPQSGIPHIGERVGFAVTIRNTSAAALRDLTVSLEVEGRNEERDSLPVPELAPGATRTVVLTGTFQRSGLRTVTARVQHDDLETDNRLDHLVAVREQVRVLVVEGSSDTRDPERGNTYFLMHALRPVPETSWPTYHLQPRMVTPANALPALLEDRDLCILVNVPVGLGGREDIDSLRPDFLERLVPFVRGGHGLILFAGPGVVPEAYNRILFEGHGLLPLPVAAPVVAAEDRPLLLEVGGIAPQSFLAPFREEPLNQVQRVATLAAQGVVEPKDEAGDQEVVLRYDNGQPAVVRRQVGGGEVVLVTTSADLNWSIWPAHPTFVPFVHLTLAHLLQRGVEPHNRLVGTPLRWHPPETDTHRVFTLVPPEGEPLRLGKPDMLEGQLVVATEATSQAGLYRIVPAEALSGGDAAAENDEPPGIPFAVTADLRESEDLEPLTDAQLDERLGFRALHLTAGDDPAAFSGAQRWKNEWTRPVLWAVLVLVLGEAALALLCGRPW